MYLVELPVPPTCYHISNNYKNLSLFEFESATPCVVTSETSLYLFDVSEIICPSNSPAEAETPILWPPHAKSWLIGKDPDAWRGWGQEEKGTTEDEMAGWRHWLNAHEFGWTLGVDDGQGGLACCNSWGRKESDMTERQNWTEFSCSFSSLLLPLGKVMVIEENDDLIM